MPSFSKPYYPEELPGRTRKGEWSSGEETVPSKIGKQYPDSKPLRLPYFVFRVLNKPVFYKLILTELENGFKNISFEALQR